MSKTVTLKELKTYEGRSLAPSSWFVVDQDRIDRFADCTDDHQYIHVDPERMKQTPLGGTIAHGFLTLSLISGHGPEDWPILEGTVMNLNYGLDRVRFIQPVRSGSRVRFLTKVIAVTEKSPGHVLIKAEKQLEVEGQSKPAMIAETLTMQVTSDAQAGQP